MRVQRLAEKEIFRPRRPIIGERVFKTGADSIFHPRGLRPWRRENGVWPAGAEDKGCRSARAAGRDAARQIKERTVISVADAAADAREKIRARIGLQGVKGQTRRIGGRRREEPVRAPAPVEQAEIRFETPDPGSALPIIAGLRADRHARPRNARRIEIEGGPAEDAARLQPLAGVKWKCGPETCAQIHPGPVEERRRRFGSACGEGCEKRAKTGERA